MPSHEFEMPELEIDAREFVPSTRIPDEVRSMAAAAQERTSRQPEKLAAHHFKIGELDVDELPTETNGFGPGLMSAGEMSSVEARLAGPWKDMSPSEQKRAIREYLELRRDTEQRPN